MNQSLEFENLLQEQKSRYKRQKARKINICVTIIGLILTITGAGLLYKCSIVNRYMYSQHKGLNLSRLVDKGLKIHKRFPSYRDVFLDGKLVTPTQMMSKYVFVRPAFLGGPKYEGVFGVAPAIKCGTFAEWSNMYCDKTLDLQMGKFSPGDVIKYYGIDKKKPIETTITNSNQAVGYTIPESIIKKIIDNKQNFKVKYCWKPAKTGSKEFCDTVTLNADNGDAVDNFLYGYATGIILDDKQNPTKSQIVKLLALL